MRDLNRNMGIGRRGLETTGIEELREISTVSTSLLALVFSFSVGRRLRGKRHVRPAHASTMHYGRSDTATEDESSQ